MNGVSTVNMSREKWLEIRKQSIGGSDAAAIVGLSKYATPFSVWANKTGRLPASEDNEAMRQGRDLESYVARRFEEASGKRCRKRSQILKNPEHSFMHANIDFAIVGEKAGLECKTTSVLNLKRFQRGEFPSEYYAQCVHYMAVTGWVRWYLAVLVLGQGFYWFTIERDENEIKALISAEKDFWKMVEMDTPPIPDGKMPTSSSIDGIYAAAEFNAVDLQNVENEVLALNSLSCEIKRLKHQAEIHRQKIKLALGEKVLGECGRYQVEWTPFQRRFLSTKRLKEVYPKIDLEKVLVSRNFRKLKIREVI